MKAKHVMAFQTAEIILMRIPLCVRNLGALSGHGNAVLDASVSPSQMFVKEHGQIVMINQMRIRPYAKTGTALMGTGNVKTGSNVYLSIGCVIDGNIA